MANFGIKNVEIKGISACVPRHEENNVNYPHLPIEEIEKFIDATGVESRRVADSGVCTSDLCYAAADKLLKDLQWDRNEIDIIVFVSQTGDYMLPVTSTILQDRLGISKECIAFDIPLGCSGYVYGLSAIAGMMRATGLKKGLLLVGDTISKWVSETDKSTYLLFGDAGAATALQLQEESESTMLFNLGSDGSGYNAIIISDSGSRNQATPQSYIPKSFEAGIERNNCQVLLDGMDVFSFGISQAPKTVNALLERFKIEKDVIDYFVFHQANLKMNKMIVKKMKLPEHKIPYSLKKFGNTSSATIPLTIVTELREAIINKRNKLIMCGFGVGLSWGTVYLETNGIICPELIEI